MAAKLQRLPRRPDLDLLADGIAFQRDADAVEFLGIAVDANVAVPPAHGLQNDAGQHIRVNAHVAGGFIHAENGEGLFLAGGRQAEGGAAVIGGNAFAGMEGVGDGELGLGQVVDDADQDHQRDERGNRNRRQRHPPAHQVDHLAGDVQRGIFAVIVLGGQRERDLAVRAGLRIQQVLAGALLIRLLRLQLRDIVHGEGVFQRVAISVGEVGRQIQRAILIAGGLAQEGEKLGQGIVADGQILLFLGERIHRGGVVDNGEGPLERIAGIAVVGNGKFQFGDVELLFRRNPAGVRTPVPRHDDRGVCPVVQRDADVLAPVNAFSLVGLHLESVRLVLRQRSAIAELIVVLVVTGEPHGVVVAEFVLAGNDAEGQQIIHPAVGFTVINGDGRRHSAGLHLVIGIVLDRCVGQLAAVQAQLQCVIGRVIGHGECQLVIVSVREHFGQIKGVCPGFAGIGYTGIIHPDLEGGAARQLRRVVGQMQGNDLFAGNACALNRDAKLVIPGLQGAVAVTLDDLIQLQICSEAHIADCHIAGGNSGDIAAVDAHQRPTGLDGIPVLIRGNWLVEILVIRGQCRAQVEEVCFQAQGILLACVNGRAVRHRTVGVDAGAGAQLQVVVAVQEVEGNVGIGIAFLLILQPPDAHLGLVQLVQFKLVAGEVLGTVAVDGAFPILQLDIGQPVLQHKDIGLADRFVQDRDVHMILVAAVVDRLESLGLAAADAVGEHGAESKGKLCQRQRGVRRIPHEVANTAVDFFVVNTAVAGFNVIELTIGLIGQIPQRIGVADDIFRIGFACVVKRDGIHGNASVVEDDFHIADKLVGLFLGNLHGLFGHAKGAGIIIVHRICSGVSVLERRDLTVGQQDNHGLIRGIRTAGKKLVRLVQRFTIVGAAFCTRYAQIVDRLDFVFTLGRGADVGQGV